MTGTAGGNESASETDTSPAERDATGPSTNQTIREAIKGLFRDAVKALTRCSDDEPPPPRRRSGETDGDFRRLARKFSHRFDVRQSFKLRRAIASRYAPIDPAAHVVAASYLSNTLGMLNGLNDSSGTDYGGGFNAISNHHTHHL